MPLSIPVYVYQKCGPCAPEFYMKEKIRASKEKAYGMVLHRDGVRGLFEPCPFSHSVMVWFLPLCRRTLSLPSTNSTWWSSPWSCSRTHHPYAVADAPWADDTNSPPADQESKKRATAGSLCVWWFAVVLRPVLLPPLWLKVTALYNLKAKRELYTHTFLEMRTILTVVIVCNFMLQVV